jgi:hypothetical protein
MPEGYQMFEPIKASKDPMTMTRREWKAELERIAHVSYARRHYAAEQAETRAAYDKIRRQNPGWEPTPLPEETPEDPDLRALKTQDEE